MKVTIQIDDQSSDFEKHLLSLVTQYFEFRQYTETPAATTEERLSDFNIHQQVMKNIAQATFIVASGNARKKRKKGINIKDL